MPTPSDPLYAQQWHLHGVYGIHADLVWDDYTGEGISVVVYDSGVDQYHPDLDGNIDYADQLDTATGLPDGSPNSSFGSNIGHGTSCAGLIAAENNGIGGVGVAYDATIVSFRDGYGFYPAYREVGWGQAQYFDIINNSWGGGGFFTDDFNDPYNAGAANARIDSSANGRGGLGTIFVQSAGNDRDDGDNVNLHNVANNTRSLTIAATTIDGDVTSYSTPGAAILVAAPGGDGASLITTTDITGAGGYSSGNYTTDFAGTSASAPIVSGVVALILEANPNLGWRDVQEILAYSARNSDPDESSTTWQTNGATNWNGGGLHFSHDLGAGLVDALAAVRLAEWWPYAGLGVGGTARASHNDYRIYATDSPYLVIPDNNATGISRSLTFTQDVEIDHIWVDLNIVHPYIGDLQVVLRSPSGTESTLVDRPGNGGSSIANISFSMTSTQFWGESSLGTWTLTVRDLAGADVGYLASWELGMQGDTPSADDVYVYTDEFATAAGASRGTLTDSGGHDYLLAAALTGNATINLTPGAVSTLAGRSLTIAASTTIEDATGGDGNDTITGNAANNRLIGGRGDDSIGGAGGADFLDGTWGNDTLIGGGGNDTLNGGLGGDIFRFAAGSGVDEIDDFEDGQDLIDLTGYSVSFSALGIAPSGSNTLITFGGGNAVTLLDVLSSAITAIDFIGLLAGSDDYAADPSTTGAVVPGGFATGAIETAGDVDWFGATLTAGYQYTIDLRGAPTGTGTLGNPLLAGVYTSAGAFIAGTSNNDNGITLDARVQYAPTTTGTYYIAAAGAGSGTGTYRLDISAGTPAGPTPANDTLTYGAGNDSIDALAGDDSVATGAGDDSVLGGDGNDTIDAGDGNDSVNGWRNDDVVYGGAGNDTLVGYLGDDSLDGGDGNDSVAAGAGNDTIDGGAGNDTLDGNDGNDSVTGGLADDSIAGGPGNDTLVGEAGSDTLNGGSGVDSLVGGPGNDVYLFVDDALDTIVEGGGGGNDKVTTYVTATLPANVEIIAATGTAAIGLTGNGLDNRIVGNDAANLLSGMAGNDTILAGDGNDTLDGGPGADRLAGGAGDDLFIVDNTGDFAYDFGEGQDTVQASVSHTLTGRMEVLILTGSAAVGTGNARANTITGTGGANTLDGGVGDDTVSGVGGDDNVQGAAGDDSLDGGAGNDQVIGGGDDDTCRGGTGDDTLNGGDGNDRLDGGAGSDRLIGGLGLDRFIFTNLADGVADIDAINDYNLAEGDIIDLPNGLADVTGQSQEAGGAWRLLLAGGDIIRLVGVTDTDADGMITDQLLIS